MADQILGGFVAIPLPALVAAWRASRDGLGAGPFRTWLAVREMAARRVAAPGRSPTFTLRELARLTNVSERSTRASIRKLTAAGLLDFRESAIEFPEAPQPVGGPFADTIGKGSGSMKVPRRLLRFLARGTRPAVIATALGTLARCLSRRRSGFDGRGRVKASWIAEAFGVDERAVKGARAELVRLGWIVPEPGDQRVENRYGRAFRINLAWAAPGCGGRKRPPLDPSKRLQTTTPSEDPEPILEEDNPEPPPRAQTGACAGGVESQPPLETLGQIRAEDLADPGRLPLVAKVVARAGLAGSSERDEIRLAALGEHCLRRGKNPAALFVALVKRGAWSFVTRAEEDAARRRLAAHREGARRVASAVPSPGRPTPSLPTFQAHPARRSTFVPDAPVGGPTALGAILGRIGGLASGG